MPWFQGYSSIATEEKEGWKKLCSRLCPSHVIIYKKASHCIAPFVVVTQDCAVNQGCQTQNIIKDLMWNTLGPSIKDFVYS